MESKTLPRTIAVKLLFDGGEHEGAVKKIALGNLAKVAEMIDAMIAAGHQVGNLDDGTSAASFLEALKTAPEKVADIVCVISTFTKDQIMQAEVESVVEVLLKGWELNNLVKLLKGAIKKAMGAQDAPQAETGSTPQ